MQITVQLLRKAMNQLYGVVSEHHMIDLFSKPPSAHENI